MPELVAHRGYAAKFPENTLPGLRAALDAGARWLECDVQLSSDRVPVLMHDVSLERTAGDPRRVHDLKAAALAGVSVHEPVRFGTRYLGTTVPTLESAAYLVGREAGAMLFVEVKDESVERFGIDTVAARVRDACEAIRERCVVISFDDSVIHAARELGGFRIGWVIRAFKQEVKRVADDLAPDFLFTNIRIVPAHGPLWPGPWRWACYDAKDADTALAMAARGFEFIETKDVAGLVADPRIAAWRR